jgi:hypothetical protein
MVKMSFGMIVFNGDYVLKQNLETIYPFAHEIIITEGPVLHYQKQGFKESSDNTVKIIKEFPDPDNKIKLIQGQWPSKDSMCNAFLKHMTGEYVWHVDSDELYKPEDIKKVLDYLEKNHKTCYSMSFKLYSFYGGFERHISGFEENFEVHRIKKIIPGKSTWLTHRPPTMLWPPTKKRCRDMGHIDHNTTDKWGIRIYHYSFVFPAQVKAKTVYYRQRGGAGIIGQYWDKLFVPWMRAKTEKDKLKVEKPTLGVQVWTPNRRGPAFTKRFEGKHPKAIEKSIPSLEKRIQEQGHELGIWT